MVWEENRIRVRRSQTGGEKKVLNSTKQRTRYGIEVPTQVMQILGWIFETQIGTPEQQDSELLFPAVTGSER